MDMSGDRYCGRVCNASNGQPTLQRGVGTLCIELGGDQEMYIVRVYMWVIPICQGHNFIIGQIAIHVGAALSHSISDAMAVGLVSTIGGKVTAGGWLLD